MAPRSRSRFPRTNVESIRRRTDWAEGANGTTGAISTSSTVLFQNAAQSLSDGQTVIRTRGELLAYLMASDVVGGGFQCGFGICKVTQNAAGVGITAVPHPLADVDWDGWMYYTQFNLRNCFAGAFTEVRSGIPGVVRIPIDSKAMRKLDADDNIVGVFETVETVTATMRAFLETRILIKLP